MTLENDCLLKNAIEEQKSNYESYHLRKMIEIRVLDELKKDNIELDEEMFNGIVNSVIKSVIERV